MSLRTHVTQGGHCRRCKLPLGGKFVVLCIRQPVLVEETWRAGDGCKKRPVDVVVRVLRGNVQRRKHHRESLQLAVAGTTVLERGGKRWGIGARIEEPERCVTDFVEIAGTLKRSKKDAISGSDAGLGIRRIGNAQPWSKVVIPSGR